MKMWQLIDTSNGAVLEGPKPLPENWGPICGMQGIADDGGLDDLSWLGKRYEGLAWVEIEVDEEPEPAPVLTLRELRARGGIL